MDSIAAMVINISFLSNRAVFETMSCSRFFNVKPGYVSDCTGEVRNPRYMFSLGDGTDTLVYKRCFRLLESLTSEGNAMTDDRISTIT